MISRILLLYGFLTFLTAMPPALAAVDVYDFSSETERQRYRHFVEELRCPKCQNQNLAGSDAPIAKDLRRELHRLLQEGRSDSEIVDFMVSRYGDYVLYRPRLQQNTLVLWGMPLVLLCLGALVFTRILRRRRMRADAAEPDPEMVALTDGERRQLDQLLDIESGDGQGAGPEQKG